MNKSESAFDRIKKLDPEQLSLLLTVLADNMSAVMEPPPDKVEKSDLYMALHPDVRRLLVELGQEENKDVLVWLLSLDKGIIGLQIELLADYRNAKNVVRLIKIVWVALASSLVAVYGFVKATPEALEWLRSFLIK